MKFPELDGLTQHVLAESHDALWRSRHLLRQFAAAPKPESPAVYTLDEDVRKLSHEAVAAALSSIKSNDHSEDCA